MTHRSLTLDAKWHNVSLRLSGDDLPVQEVEERLRLTTRFTGIKGRNIGDDPRYARYQTSFWTWEFTTDTAVPFEEQLADVLPILEERRTPLRELLSLPGVQGELFLGYGSESGQGGAYFPPEQLTRLGALGLAIGLDLYPPERDPG